MIFADPDIKYEIGISPNMGARSDAFHVVVRVTAASSKERAQQAAYELSSLFTFGREMLWRVEPEGSEQINFETNEKERLGYARFSFRLRPGQQHFESSVSPGSLAELKL